MGYASERVVRAPGEGVLRGVKAIGDTVEAGDVVARVGDQPVLAPISGVLHGLLADGLVVREGMFDYLGPYQPDSAPSPITRTRP